MHGRNTDSATPKVAVWRAIMSAFCACLIGVGLARFAYTPLLPALVDAHWFAASAAAYLGAANLAGYLAGAVLGRPIASRVPAVIAIRAMMLIATGTFFACAFPLGFAWFFVWRFAAGLAGGALMVLAAPGVLANVPAARRGLAGGFIFMGVGAGVAASGTLVPLLLRQGLVQAWFGLAAASLLAMLAGWSGWPAQDSAASDPAQRPHGPQKGTLRALYAEYGLNAAGWVPHMIFLVDFVARGLGQGIAAGAEYWVLFGLGATFGPIVAGHLADRAGFGTALRLAFLLEAVAIALPASGVGPAPLILSSVIVGAFVTGTVPLVLGRIGELLPHHPTEQKTAWSVATVAFALCQATSAYALSFIFARSGENYRLLFLIGAVAMVMALAVDLIAIVRASRTAHLASPKISS